jgi:hypothetical protein
MRIRSHPMWSLTVSLMALASLSACGVLAGNPPHTSAITTSPATAATGVTSTAAVAAPLTTQGTQTKKWIDLQVGDCLADAPPSDPSVVTVTTVDCATAHQAEVFLRAPVGVNAAITDVANQECAGGFSQYTGRTLDGSEFAVAYLIDSNQDRTSTDPTPSSVICLLQAANGQPLMQSARH